MKSLLVGVLTLVSSTAWAGTDPRAVYIKVYSVMVSPNVDCTNPIPLFEDTTPEYVDFVKKANFGKGSAPNGRYECVIIRMSDRIRFIPSVTQSLCTAGQEYFLDVCRGSDGSTTDNPLTAESTACTGGEDIVWLYLSTGSVGIGMGSFNRPTGEGSGNGLILENAFEISGNSAAKFVADFRGRVQDENGACGCEAPSFSFKKQNE